MSSSPRSSGDIGLNTAGSEYATPETGMPSQQQGVTEKAMQSAEVGRERAAEGMHKGADQLRTRFAEGEGMQAQVGTRVADSLDRASSYLREHETTEIWDDMERVIRDHPMSAAATALVTGFVLARVLR